MMKSVPSTTFLNTSFGAPVMIDSMTGGTNEASKINARLGSLAEKYGFAMGVGSQRAGLLNAEMADDLYGSQKKCAKCLFNCQYRWGSIGEGIGRGRNSKDHKYDQGQRFSNPS